MEYQQHQQRADAGRRQCRENGQGMDITLVQHAQNDVDRHQRGENQIGLALQRTLKGLGGALEASGDGRGQAHVCGNAVDRIDRLAQRRAGRQVERQRHGGKLALVIDRQIGHMLGIVLGHCRQRDHLTREGRFQVQLVERCRIGLQRRRDFEYHVVAVGLREELRRLALAERIVQCLIDGLRLDAEARRLVAIDGERQHAAAGLLIRRHVAQHRELLQFGEQLRRPVVELVDVRVLQGVLVLRSGSSAAHVEILRGLHEQRRSRHRGQF